MDSDSILDLLSALGSDKEGTANNLFNALSIAAIYGRRASTSTGLTWGYYGGRFNSTLVASGTVTLQANATNYIVVAVSTGVVSVSTSPSNWDNTTDYTRLYRVVTGPSTATSWEDHRQILRASGGGGSGQALPLVEVTYAVEYIEAEFGPTEALYD